MIRAYVAPAARLDDARVRAITAVSRAARRSDRAGAWCGRNSARPRCRPTLDELVVVPKSIGSRAGSGGGGQHNQVHHVAFRRAFTKKVMTPWARIPSAVSSTIGGHGGAVQVRDR